MTMHLEAPLITLARRAAGGEEAAREELLRELEPIVVRSVRLIVGAGSWVAEDAAQDALLDIARGVGSLREPGAVKTWALRVATQRAIKIARREQLLALRRRPTNDPALTTEPESGRAVAIKEAFDSLPPRLRVTAVLRLYVGMSEEETAQTLGTSIGTVKSNLHDARKRLTEALRERGFAPTVSPKEAL